MSITATSTAFSMLESAIAANLSSTMSASQTTSTSAVSSSTASTGSDSFDILTKDLVTLLKDLASGDGTAARVDLSQLKADLTNAEAAVPSDASGTVNSDLVSLLKDLASGNKSGASTDLGNLQKDLNPADSSSSSNLQTSSLDALTNKMETYLGSGSMQNAVQELASYFVQNGQGTGTVLNTAA